MLTLRRTDFFLQILLAALMVLSIPIYWFIGFLAGLFILGIWQLLSAFLNTRRFLSTGMGLEICTYWKFTGLVFATVFISVILDQVVEVSWWQGIALAAGIGSVALAIYYLHIYHILVERMALREELDGLTKSKHG